MRKIFFSLIIILSSLTCLAQADVWKYKVTSAVRIGNVVNIGYDILRDDVFYMADAAQISIADLIGKTVNQKKSFADNQIQIKCLPIIYAAQETTVFDSVVGTTVTITVP